MGGAMGRVEAVCCGFLECWAVPSINQSTNHRPQRSLFFTLHSYSWLIDWLPVLVRFVNSRTLSVSHLHFWFSAWWGDLTSRIRFSFETLGNLLRMAPLSPPPPKTTTSSFNSAHCSTHCHKPGWVIGLHRSVTNPGFGRRTSQSKFTPLGPSPPLQQGLNSVRSSLWWMFCFPPALFAESDNPNVASFIRNIFGILYEVYCTSAGTAIRHKCSEALLKMTYHASPELLTAVMQRLPISRFEFDFDFEWSEKTYESTRVQGYEGTRVEVKVVVRGSK